jgi:hypothetical protein
LRILFFIVLLIFVEGCSTVSFQKLPLYVEQSIQQSQLQEEEKIEPIIYLDGIGTMWNSLFECGDFEIVKGIAHSGNASIKISWDKGKGCQWIGFGNSFSNWAPANVGEYQNKKAISFFVRTQKNSSRSIPIVLGLEDFGGGGTYLFTDTRKYLYGLEIDTTWKQIIVPMWHFPTDPGASGNDDVDITAIKQLQFQLEGAGSFYLDEIKLIDFSEAEYQKMLAEVEAMKPKGNINQIVYREGELKEDAWATGETFCQTLEEKTDIENNTYIYWKFNADNCEWAKWGINWNDWHQINFRGIENDAKIQFKIKASVETRFKIVLEDFAGNSTQLYSSFSISENQSAWQTIDIALKDFNIEGTGFKLDQVKQLLFVGLTAGEVYLDDIKIMDAWTH